eukprot:Gb_22238 [translate_table: standard]
MFVSSFGRFNTSSSQMLIWSVPLKGIWESLWHRSIDQFIEIVFIHSVIVSGEPLGLSQGLLPLALCVLQLSTFGVVARVQICENESRRTSKVVTMQPFFIKSLGDFSRMRIWKNEAKRTSKSRF